MEITSRNMMELYIKHLLLDLGATKKQEEVMVKLMLAMFDLGIEFGSNGKCEVNYD